MAACGFAAFGQMNTGEIFGVVKDQLGGLPGDRSSRRPRKD
jgi:hypothetical protein